MAQRSRDHRRQAAYRNETPRPGRLLLRAVRPTIESVNDTLEDQLGLERHGGRTPTGVMVRVLQRILALTAAIWHNDRTRQPVKTIPGHLGPLTLELII